MNNHILSCGYVPPQVKVCASRHKRSTTKASDTDDDGSTVTASSSSQVTLKQSHPLIEPNTGTPSQGRTDARSAKKQKAFTIVATKHAPFNQKWQTLFDDQLLNAWILAGFSFNSIEDPEVRKLFSDFLPGAVIPHRDQLSGTILKRAVAWQEYDLRTAAKGQFATLQCDGWKDVARKHLIAFMYTMAREVRDQIDMIFID